MICRYFLAVWILTSSAVSGQSTQYGLVGQTVTFRTDIRDRLDDILWKHNGNKVVQFDGNEQTEYSQFQKRITLDWHSADLEINQLTHSDSGQYELDAAKGGGLTRLIFELEVLDRVTKPTITCNMRDGSSSDKSGSKATLMCSADSSQSLNYEWSQPGKNQSGQILTIPLGTEHDDKVYSCTASNRLSKEIATFTAKDCYPVGVSAGLITGVVIGGIVLLLCVLVAVFCALKHKAHFAKKEKRDVEQQPHREPLIHREETMLSSQPLRRLAEIVRNHNFDHNDEKHNELDLGTRESKVMKIVKKFEPGPADPVTIENKVEKEKEDSESENMTEENLSTTTPEQTDSEKRDDEETQVSIENGSCPSAAQPSSPLTNKAAVSAEDEDVNSDQATGKKRANESRASVMKIVKKFEPGPADPVTIENKVEKEKEDSESENMTEENLSTTTPEQTDLVKMADDNQISASENDASSSAAELLSSKMASNNDAGEHVDDSNSEQTARHPHGGSVGK